VPDIVVGSPWAAIEPPLSWLGLCVAVLLIVIRTDIVAGLLRGRIAGAMRLAFQVSAVLIPASALGPVWWHYWMYYGWAGPPSWIGAALSLADGSTIWSVHKEMMVCLCLSLTMMVLAPNILAARARR